MTITNSNLKKEMDVLSPIEGAGTELNRTRSAIRGILDVAIQGTSGSLAAGSYGLVDEYGAPCTLPPGAVVVGCKVNVVTAPVGTGATVGATLLTANDLMAQTAITSLTAGVDWNGKPVAGGAGAANTVVGPVVAAGGSQVKGVVGTAILTAGRLAFEIEYKIAN
jgi:hypothetical protein